MTRTLLTSAVLLCAVLMIGPAGAAEKFISRTEAAQLAAEASNGKKRALKKLLNSYDAYRMKVQDGEVLTPAEQDAFTAAGAALKLLAPDEFLQMQTDDEAFSSETSRPENAAESYLTFREGETLIYRGSTMRFHDHRWVDNDGLWRSQVLKISEVRRNTFKILLLDDFFEQKGALLKKEVLTSWLVSPDGVTIQKNIVFNRPSRESFSPIGEQEAYRILRLPPKEGDIVDGVRIRFSTYAITAASASYSGCLHADGLVERLTFAPETGLISVEMFEEKWTLKEKTGRPVDARTRTRIPDKKMLEDSIRRLLKKNKLQFVSILTLSTSRSTEAVPSAAPGPAPAKPAEKLVIYARTLAYQNDKKDPDHRRYQVLEQNWVREAADGVRRWKPQ